MSTKTIGDKGEDEAAAYLMANGYELLKRNYRFKRAEVDIIAKLEHIIVFVEVKTRKNDAFGHPESFVDVKKLALLSTAASHYTESTNWQGDIRFDIIAITDGELNHFEDIS